MFDVNGKRAIVTGAAQGFGKEFTHRLVNKGCKVCMADIDVGKGNEAKNEIKTKFGLKDSDIHFIRCDVASASDWINLWDEAEKILGGKIELLCNNAGISPLLGWEKCLDVMSVGVCHGTMLAVERMSRSKGGNGGRIVITASVSGLTVGSIGPEFQSFGYNVAKWGNVALTRYFKEFYPDIYQNEGIKCYALAPWAADTQLLRFAFEQENRFVDSAFGRINTVEDLQRVTRHRLLSAEDVGQSLMDAIDLDRNGAVYVVFPDLPIVETPYLNMVIFALMIFFGKIVTKLFGVKAVRTWHFYICLFVLLYICFYLFNCFLYWLI